MDRKLQKLILKIIRDNNGVVEWPIIVAKTRDYFPQPRQPEDIRNTIIKHQLDLLKEDGKITRQDDDPSKKIFYILTPLGEREFYSFWERTGYFILYDKHNLFIILSLLLSCFSLYISFLALKKP